ncbi:MAG: glycosyltransferase family 2 protein [Gemmiger sp.]
MADRFLVFIPAYNCEKQVPRVLDQLLDPQVAALGADCIVVNNRATDGTEQAVQDWMAAHPAAPVRLLRNDENYGLGGSHKVAFGYAAEHGYDYLVVLHGDDQGDIRDLLPLVHSGAYKKYDCCLGSRFMKGSRIRGYSALRVAGNYGFNLLFSLVARKKITDLGSGLNLYRVSSLKNGYYKTFPDTLYFNDCMILALCHYRQQLLFFPISWREEDQVSNNKLTSFAISLLKLCGQYLKSPRAFVEKEWREKTIETYSYRVVADNLQH